MPANFTSGWLGNDAAWHGQGSSPKAPCQRERRLKLQTHSLLSRSESLTPVIAPSHSTSTLLTQAPSELSVPTLKPCLGLSQNSTRSSRTIRSFGWQSSSAKRDMDCVIVLADGAKVCFTATLRGAQTDIVPGDTVKRRIVGYLGHDGKTGCGAKFTNIRSSEHIDRCSR